MNMKLNNEMVLVLMLSILTSCSVNNQRKGINSEGLSILNWYRPDEQPVFSQTHGNNHDPILFVEPGLDYPYHLIVSHTEEYAHLWRSQKFSWNSADWELVTDQYIIGNHYEYDDGVRVGDTYYIYEKGNVYSFSGSLEEANGNWVKAGTFPVDQCDDIGVYYEDGVFHIFGEYGDFPAGPDGTSLSHFKSSTGTGEWELVDYKAVDPNPDGGDKYGVGDATVVKIKEEYYLFCDRETEELPYRIVAWKSSDINKPFEFLDVIIEPRSGQTRDWDNHRIQDGDIGYVAEEARYVMMCNMKDIDGRPGYSSDTTYARNHLKGEETRVIGTFYMDVVQH